MDYDRLGEPTTHAAWAEASVVEGFARHWDRELHGLDIPEWRRSVVRLIERTYHAGTGQAVVVADMGCGAATYARHLLATGIAFEYHGYDHNEHVLEAACQRWAFLPHETVKLHLMDARSTPWPIAADTFDVLVWDTTLRFCEDVEAAFAESCRTCRGSIILARTPLAQETCCRRVPYYGMAEPSPDWQFDRSFLGDLARRHDLQLTTGVGDEEMHVLSRQPLDDETTIKTSPRPARFFHEAYVIERVARLFEQVAGPWVIFGAGQHSRWLLGVLPRDLKKRISLLIDDDARSGDTIAGIPVRTPADVQGAGALSVLVSSDTIEETLYWRAARWLGDPARAHVLYEGLPSGPYDKSVVWSADGQNVEATPGLHEGLTA